jgi:glycosyltransferase involved in cell wall biosynthesis
MKVVFLNATGQLGGAERMLIGLLKALRSEQPGWTLQVVTGDDGPLIPLLAGLGYDVDVLRMPPRLAQLGEASSKNPLAVIMAAAAAVRYRNQLRTLLDSRSPDVIHTMNFKMHLLAACSPIAGSKLCWHIHDFVSNRFLTRKLLRLLSDRPSCVVAISECVARDMVSISKLPERITTVLNAVDLDHFSPAGPTWPITSGPSVGFVATFARWKGHEVFLRAVASLPCPVHAYIAGGGIYRTGGSQITQEELQSRVEALGLAGRVTFTGFLEDTAPLLRSLDVVVHASTEPEPFGLTIAEAMACGRAVVASMAGGVTEILDDGVNGLGHSPGDVHGLAQAIERLLRDPELRRHYGSAARNTAEARLDPRRMARQFIEVYASCLR